jgi:hypothetical protein
MSNSGTSLIVMRLADMVVRHEEQINGLCHRCNAVVGIFPSGQEVMVLQSNVEVVCMPCFMAADETYDMAIQLPREGSRVDG